MGKEIRNLKIEIGLPDDNQPNPLGISKQTSVSGNLANQFWLAEKEVDGGKFHHGLKATSVEISKLSMKFFKKFEYQVVILGTNEAHGPSYSISSITEMITRTKTVRVPDLAATTLKLQDLKEFLEVSNIPYSVCDISEPVPGCQWTVGESAQVTSGEKEFPQVYIQGRFMGGLHEIKKLAREGKLDDYKLNCPQLLDNELESLIVIETSAGISCARKDVESTK